MVYEHVDKTQQLHFDKQAMPEPIINPKTMPHHNLDHNKASKKFILRVLNRG